MANNISMWAQGIIVAIIVGTLIQMLLPENKNKKYIKVVIGIYILFCIISPVVGKELTINDIGLENYLNIENIETKENESKYTYNESVKETFKNKVMLNIKGQLKARGYESNNIDVQINDECRVLKVTILDITNAEEEEKEVENKVSSIVINKIDTSSAAIKEKKITGIATSDKNSIIDYLIENYQIDRKNIIIE